VVFTLDNLTGATSYGLEVALDVPVNPRWTVKMAGNLTEYEIEPIAGLFQSLGALTSSQSPSAQVSIRSLFDVRDDIDLDIWLRHVGELAGGVGDSYEDLDIRLAWRPGPKVELALQGENLLASSRVEYLPAVTGLVAPGAIVERQVKISLRSRF
jgi:iron complex outermembrane receptor protein